MIIVLPGERPVSWNKLYSGMHWGDRKDLATTLHELVFYAIREETAEPVMYEKRVRITVRAYFKNRPLDPCNIPAKIYIDGLLGVLIEDDSMKYVAGVTTESYVDKDRPRVEVEIVEES